MANHQLALKNVTSLYGLQVANYLIPLLMLPFMVRTLGTHSYGWLALAAAFNFYFVLLVDAGMNSHASRELAQLDPLRQSRNSEKAATLVANTTALKAILVIASASVMAVVVGLTPEWKGQAALFAVSFLPVLGSLLFPTWLFQGLQIMHYTMAYSVVGRVIAAIAILGLVRGPDDLVLAAALQGSATVFSGILALHVIWRLPGMRWCWPRCAGVRDLFKQSRSLALSEFSLTALANSTVLIVGMAHTKDIVGVYAAIEKAMRAALGLFTPLIQALQPRMVQAWQFSAKDVPPLLLVWSLRVVGAALAASIAGVVLTPWLLTLLFGQVVTSYTHWGQIFCIGLPLSVANAMLGMWWWIASGRQAAYAPRVALGVGIQATLFLGCAMLVGITWALWAWVLAEALMLALLFHRSRWQVFKLLTPGAQKP